MTQLPKRHTQILAFYDALLEKDASVVASALAVSINTVYAVLRRYRPDRKRKPRPRLSDKRRQILGLASCGYKAARVAELVGVSKAYVYRVLADFS